MLPSMRSTMMIKVPRRRDYPFDIRAHMLYEHSILEVHACFEKGRGELIRAHTLQDNSTIPSAGVTGVLGLQHIVSGQRLAKGSDVPRS